MCLKKTGREFSQFKKCQMVDHFVRQGIARRAVHNALN
jgi:hypothetical protein